MSSFSDILENNPHIFKLLRINKNNYENDSNELKKLLLNEIKQFDLIFDLQNNRKSKNFTNNLSSKIYKVEKDYLKKILLVNFKNKNIFINPIPEKYFLTLKDFTSLNRGNGSEIYLSDTNNIKTDKIVIGIAPGAKHFTKKWSTNYYIKLMELIYKDYNNVVFKIFGGNEEIGLGEQIVENYPNEIINFCGKLKLMETSKEISSCDYFITNDSGLMHIASSFKIPNLAIFGSTVTNFGFQPYKTPFEISELDLNCRPCSHIGKSKCPKGHFDCMMKLYPENVFEKFKQLINKTNPSH